MDTPTIPRGPLLASTVVLDLCMLAGAVAGGWWLGLPWWQDLGIHTHGLVVGTIAGLVLIGAIWSFVHSDGPAFASLRSAFQRDLREVFAVLAPLGTADLLLISLGAGLFEEALFRGLLESAGDAWLGAGPVVAAVAFGLAHPISRVYFGYVTVLGLVLSGVAVLGEGLFAAMVAHAVYDAVALVAGRQSTVIVPAVPAPQG